MSTGINRKYSQLHLSTLIFLMIIAALFVGANTLGRTSHTEGELRLITYGWPYSLYLQLSDDANNVKALAKQEDKSATVGDVNESINRAFNRSTQKVKASTALAKVHFTQIEISNSVVWRIAVNVAVAVASLILTAIICEYFIRRHSKTQA